MRTRYPVYFTHLYIMVLIVFGHVQRMEGNRIPRRVSYMNLGKTRLRGRPRNRWEDGREDGRIVGGEGWQKKVYNREEWKKFLRMARNRRILHMPMEWMNRIWWGVTTMKNLIISKHFCQFSVSSPTFHLKELRNLLRIIDSGTGVSSNWSTTTFSPLYLVLHYPVLRAAVADVGTALAGYNLGRKHITLIECSPHVKVGPVLISPADDGVLRHCTTVARLPVAICNMYPLATAHHSQCVLSEATLLQ